MKLTTLRRIISTEIGVATLIFAAHDVRLACLDSLTDIVGDLTRNGDAGELQYAESYLNEAKNILSFDGLAAHFAKDGSQFFAFIFAAFDDEMREMIGPIFDTMTCTYFIEDFDGIHKQIDPIY